MPTTAWILTTTLATTITLWALYELAYLKPRRKRSQANIERLDQQHRAQLKLPPRRPEH